MAAVPPVAPSPVPVSDNGRRTAMAPGFPCAVDDDIASLQSSLGLVDFPYVDMRALTDRQTLLARWPLLADMHAAESEPPACSA